MRKLSRVGPPDARKRACPVRAGAGRKPTAERQKWAPSFDQHYRHIGEEDKIGSDNSAFSVLIWNWFATRLEGKPKGLIPRRRIIGTGSGRKTQ